MSLSVRVIPCLDVDQGRVVKGVNFVDLRDAVSDPKRGAFNLSGVRLTFLGDGDRLDRIETDIRSMRDMLFDAFQRGRSD